MISLPFFDAKQADTHFRGILNLLQEAVVCEAKGGKVTVANPRFLSMTGWSGEYRDQPLDDLISAWVSRATHPQTVEAYFQACRGPTPPEGAVELQPNPGQVIEARFQVLKDTDGTEYRVWLFQEWRTSALAWVSHEIKNPLNAVLGFSELLTEALGSDPHPDSVKESLRGLKVGAKHLQMVLGDLLDLSRLESGVVEPRPEWVSLPLFVEDLAALFQTRFRRRGLEFQIQLPENSEVEILIDPLRLAQVLGNFLANALRFTKRGWVAIKVVQTGHQWEFAIEDSGVGIPTDQQDAIFEPFVQKQGQDPHRFGGTGLGLAICKALVQSLGGRLGLTSQPGMGSRFAIFFDALDSRPIPPPQPSAPQKSLPELSILVADDERSNHLLVKGFLRHTPITILSANDGVEAVAVWKAYRPRVALIDLRMPGLSGIEAAKKIRALDPKRETFMLAVSATKMTREEEVEGAGLWSGFLEKPFGKRDLLKFLSNHLTFVDESRTSP